jgi:hypothetical protein
MTPNIHTIMRQHVSLAVRCIDRVYLHAYMPKGAALLEPPIFVV